MLDHRDRAGDKRKARRDLLQAGERGFVLLVEVQALRLGDLVTQIAMWLPWAANSERSSGSAGTISRSSGLLGTKLAASGVSPARFKSGR